MTSQASTARHDSSGSGGDATAKRSPLLRNRALTTAAARKADDSRGTGTGAGGGGAGKSGGARTAGRLTLPAASGAVKKPAPDAAAAGDSAANNKPGTQSTLSKHSC